MVVALAQQVGGLAHDLGAVIGRGRPPHGEALFGGAERGVEIGGRGMGQMAEHLAGGRIDDILALAAFAVEPLSVDEKLEIGVHERLTPDRKFVGGDLALSQARGYDPR
jgi:hypothetical protein